MSRPRGGSAVPLCVGRISHHFQRAESVAYLRSSISKLLAFRGGTPRLGKLHSIGVELKVLISNAVCSLDHRWRPYPLRYCFVGSCLCRWFPPALPAPVGRRSGAVDVIPEKAAPPGTTFRTITAPVPADSRQ